MPVDPVRSTAVSVLLRVFEQGAFLAVALDQSLGRTRLSERGRRFLTQLVYGTVRYRLLCDSVLEPILHQRLDELPKPIAAILRMAVFQSLFCAQVTPPAMVHTAVELAKKWGHSGTARIVNAVLKRAPQSIEEVVFPDRETAFEKHLSVRHSMPLWLVEKWVKDHGPISAESLCKASNTEAPVTLRVNTLRISPEMLLARLKKSGYSAEKRTQIPEEVTYLDGPPPSRLKLFQEGFAIVQDAASMLAAHLLEPKPEEWVLDMCAAPGGKTTHLAQYTDDRAHVAAMDVRARKLRLVRDNAQRLGLHNISLVCADGTRPPFNACFDRVLVDAPCTGLGTLRRHPDLKWRLKPDDAKRLAGLQYALLRSAVRLCKNGGLVVYAVCTFSPQETMEMAQAIGATGTVEFEDGAPWLNQWRTDRGQYTILPQENGPDGFFLMRLRRVS